MNATFNIRRFGLNIYKELLEKYKTILGFWAVILLIHLMTWGMALLIGDNFVSGTRATFVLALLQLYCCIAPFILYKNENRRTEGIFYGIAPASTLEKTLTIFVIVTLLFPVTTTLLMLSFDSLLSVIPTENGFAGHLWNNIFSGDRYMSGMLNFQTDTSRDLIDRAIDGIPTIYFNPFISVMTSQCCFVFMSMLFRKHKISKTILVICAAGFLFSLIATLSIVTMSKAFDAAELTALETETVINWIKTVFKILILFTFYVMPIVFWALTYFRIRRIQY